ncbi:hypothetical protein HDU76_007506 [Blyttiomyces sp. JEL0837]|nr:hypothetical protein HDU76_007506 [Blyttiomyces sp. JEL0837]
MDPIVAISKRSSALLHADDNITLQQKNMGGGNTVSSTLPGVGPNAPGAQVPSDMSNDPTLNFTQSVGPTNGAGKGCYFSPNLAIGMPLDNATEPFCDPGFYCPNVNASDPATIPVYCPPSAGCALARLGNLPCAAQGKYEPIICKGGWYCPDYLTMLPCPAGYFCPTGTVRPYKCNVFSRCPEGSVSPVVYGTIVLMLVLDALLAVLILISKAKSGYFKKGTFSFAQIGALILGPDYALQERARKTAMQYNEMAEKEAKIIAEMNGGVMGKGGIPMQMTESQKVGSQMKILVDAFNSALGSRGLRMNFKFEGLSLTLKGGKKVLEGVTGEIKAKRMTAILGPSGAGKTTFMNVLMGKVPRTGGKLYINGELTEMDLYRKIIGYVPQEDVMLRELSVRENILHAARVRLPGHWGSSQIEEHVDNVLKALGLSHVADTLIGDENSRGVSGGQRKRVNIGMELAAAPLAMFLDEPTSGLDSTAALDVADILSNIAQLGLTIVAVIHQPRIEIFRKFDDVLMIAPGGQVAYLGPTNMAQAYFESLGFEFDPLANTSDTLMDILAGKGVNRQYSLTPQQLVEAWEKRDKSGEIFVEAPLQMVPPPMMESEEYFEYPEEYDMNAGMMNPGMARNRPHSMAGDPNEEWFGGVNVGMGGEMISSAASMRSVKRYSHPEDVVVPGNVYDPRSGTPTLYNGSPAIPDHNLFPTQHYQPYGPDYAGSIGVAGVPASSRLQRPTNATINQHHASLKRINSVSSFQRLSVPADAMSVHSYHAAPGADDWMINSAAADPAHVPDLQMRANRAVSSHNHMVNPDYNASMMNMGLPVNSLSLQHPAHLSVGIMPIPTVRRNASHLSLNSTGNPAGRRGPGSDDTLDDNTRNLDYEFHRLAPQVVRSRGAGFMRQVWLCHQRSLLQQSRCIMALVLEIFVAMFAGMLMGVSTNGKVKELFNGIYWGRYVSLSPAPMDLLSLYGLLIGIAVALAGAPAGVKVFGEEKPVFWREAAAGHSKLAYYLGKTISTIYRLVLTSLHFTALYMILAKPVLDVYTQYAVVFLQFWGVYGISCIISMIVRRENAPLLSVVVGLFAAVFCGYGPSLTQAKRWNIMFIYELSFNKWAAEAQYAASTAMYKDRYNVEFMAQIWGYSLTQINKDLIMCVMEVDPSPASVDGQEPVAPSDAVETKKIGSMPASVKGSQTQMAPPALPSKSLSNMNTSSSRNGSKANLNVGAEAGAGARAAGSGTQSRSVSKAEVTSQGSRAASRGNLTGAASQQQSRAASKINMEDAAKVPLPASKAVSSANVGGDVVTPSSKVGSKADLVGGASKAASKADLAVKGGSTAVSKAASKADVVAEATKSSAPASKVASKVDMGSEATKGSVPVSKGVSKADVVSEALKASTPASKAVSKADMSTDVPATSASVSKAPSKANMSEESKAAVSGSKAGSKMDVLAEGTKASVPASKVASKADVLADATKASLPSSKPATAQGSRVASKSNILAETTKPSSQVLKTDSKANIGGEGGQAPKTISKADVTADLGKASVPASKAASKANVVSESGKASVAASKVNSRSNVLADVTPMKASSKGASKVDMVGEVTKAETSESAFADVAEGASVSKAPSNADMVKQSAQASKVASKADVLASGASNPISKTASKVDMASEGSKVALPSSKAVSQANVGAEVGKSSLPASKAASKADVAKASAPASKVASKADILKASSPASKAVSKANVGEEVLSSTPKATSRPDLLAKQSAPTSKLTSKANIVSDEAAGMEATSTQKASNGDSELAENAANYQSESTIRPEDVNTRDLQASASKSDVAASESLESGVQPHPPTGAPPVASSRTGSRRDISAKSKTGTTADLFARSQTGSIVHLKSDDAEASATNHEQPLSHDSQGETSEISEVPPQLEVHQKSPSAAFLNAEHPVRQISQGTVDNHLKMSYEIEESTRAKLEQQPTSESNEPPATQDSESNGVEAMEKSSEESPEGPTSREQSAEIEGRINQSAQDVKAEEGAEGPYTEDFAGESVRDDQTTTGSEFFSNRTTEDQIDALDELRQVLAQTVEAAPEEEAIGPEDWAGDIIAGQDDDGYNAELFQESGQAKSEEPAAAAGTHVDEDGTRYLDSLTMRSLQKGNTPSGLTDVAAEMAEDQIYAAKDELIEEFKGPKNEEPAQDEAATQGEGQEEQSAHVHAEPTKEEVGQDEAEVPAHNEGSEETSAQVNESHQDEAAELNDQTQKEETGQEEQLAQVDTQAQEEAQAGESHPDEVDSDAPATVDAQAQEAYAEEFVGEATKDILAAENLEAETAVAENQEAGEKAGKEVASGVNEDAKTEETPAAPDAELEQAYADEFEAEGTKDEPTQDDGDVGTGTGEQEGAGDVASGEENVEKAADEERPYEEAGSNEETHAAPEQSNYGEELFEPLASDELGQTETVEHPETVKTDNINAAQAEQATAPTAPEKDEAPTKQSDPYADEFDDFDALAAESKSAEPHPAEASNNVGEQAEQAKAAEVEAAKDEVGTAPETTKAPEDAYTMDDFDDLDSLMPKEPQSQEKLETTNAFAADSYGEEFEAAPETTHADTAESSTQGQTTEPASQSANEKTESESQPAPAVDTLDDKKIDEFLKNASIEDILKFAQDPSQLPVSDPAATEGDLNLVNSSSLPPEVKASLNELRKSRASLRASLSLLNGGANTATSEQKDSERAKSSRSDKAKEPQIPAAEPHKDVNYVSLVASLRREIVALRSEIGSRDSALEGLQSREKDLKNFVDMSKKMSKDAVDKNTRILLDRQKKAYQILVAKLRREIRRLKFQRNSLSDPLIEAKYFPYLPRTPYGTSARKPPIGIIGNLPSRSSDYFALNPPPPTGNHPESGNRWWWGSGPDLSSHLPPPVSKTGTPGSGATGVRKSRGIRPSTSIDAEKLGDATLPPSSNSRRTSTNTPALPVKLEPLKPYDGDNATLREVRVGDRACVVINEERCLGMVKYVGIFDPYPSSGLWCGIKLDRPLGKHDGVVRGKRYFSCEENHGLFVKIDKVLPVVNAQAQNVKRPSTINRVSQSQPVPVSK